MSFWLLHHVLIDTKTYSNIDDGYKCLGMCQKGAQTDVKCLEDTGKPRRLKTSQLK